MFAGSVKLFTLLLTILAPLTDATIFTAEALTACQSIQATGVYTQTYPALLSADFGNAKSHFWSAAHGDLTPACAVFPTSAKQVSQIVRIIKKTQNVKFSVKSGGHNPNLGYGSVHGGVLISMGRIATTTLSKDKKTADVGPGARWLEVIGTLDPSGVTVVGGRLGDVGVGGLLLGGGLSFLSAQYGLPCDNVDNYEIVLASGEIVNANADNNTDLFWALKGGGSQFGIVTKFTLKTYPISKVWGGLRIYNGNQAPAIIDAVHDFTEDFDDPKTAIIATPIISALSVLNVVDIVIIFFFYDGPTHPKGVFDKFNSIPHTSDGCTTRTYADLLKATDAYDQYGLRYNIRGTPLPNLPSPAGKSLLNTHYTTWRNYVAGPSLLNLKLGFIFTIDFQPLPYTIPTQSLSIGGPNPLGLKPEKGDLMWMGYNVGWLSSAGDHIANTMAMNITATVDEYVRRTYGGMKNSNAVEEKGGVVEEGLEYGPIFMNDAMFDQDPLRSYGSVNYEKLKGIQRSVDLDGFFRSRTGGFKFT